MYVKEFTSKNISYDSTVDLSGGKGHNLIEMRKQMLPVPSGLVITTEACLHYRGLTAAKKKAFLNKLMKEIKPILSTMYHDVDHGLYSVRSSGAISMPGMMDTVLNVGAGYYSNGITQKKKLHVDCQKRFVDMFMNVVEGIDRKEYIEDLDEKWPQYLGYIKDEYKTKYDVIKACIAAVFESWDNERASTYRELNGIDHNAGTAVVIQCMVFGNMNNKSATGVIFSRNPDTGVDEFYGDWLANAQGEDVVAGIADTKKIDSIVKWNPDVGAELAGIAKKLELDCGEMQDIEFTVQNGRLFILQTRRGARSSVAEARIAIDLVTEGLVNAVSDRMSAGTLAKTLKPTLPSDFDAPIVATGIPAGGYLATGRVCTSVQQVLDCNGPAVLVSEETTPDDIQGMAKAVGILTTKGGATSHAAVVARAMNKPCIVGCSGAGAILNVNFEAYILIDGQTGYVYMSDSPFDINITPELNMQLFGKYLSMIDTTNYTVVVDNLEQAKQLDGMVEKVCVPSGTFEKSDVKLQLAWLRDRFKFVLILNQRKSDTVADFIGVPITSSDEVIGGIEALIGAWGEMGSPTTVMFDTADEPNRKFVVREFKTMADVVNPEFIGLVTREFIEKVMGDDATFTQITNDWAIKDRTIRTVDLFTMIESELGIG